MVEGVKNSKEIKETRGHIMTYEFNILTQEQAENIAYNLHYDGEYSFYNMEADEEDLANS